jgi:hypothetical protein
MPNLETMLNGHDMNDLKDAASDRLRKVAGESLDDLKGPAIEQTIEFMGGPDNAPALALVTHIINELMAGEPLPMDFLTDDEEV